MPRRKRPASSKAGITKAKMDRKESDEQCKEGLRNEAEKCKTPDEGNKIIHRKLGYAEDVVVSDINALTPVLDSATQELIQLIFSEDMFKHQMSKFKIDVKKLPPGDLNKSHLTKSFKALEELEKAVQENTEKGKLGELSSKFHTIIPHTYRKTPPPIDSVEKINAKKDILSVLEDIEFIFGLLREKKDNTKTGGDAIPHPLDVMYGFLKCKLELLDPLSDEHQMINRYAGNTNSGDYAVEKRILHIWKVERKEEANKTDVLQNITNHRLLWNGTNLARVAAILKTGLPHSRGPVGRGIYHTPAHSKACKNVRATKDRKTVMFLSEVALGKEHHIFTEDSSLTRPPEGYDSVVVKGQHEPDPWKDTVMTLDGNKVVVPEGKMILVPDYSSYHAQQSDYVVYNQSQTRIRYVCIVELC